MGLRFVYFTDMLLFCLYADIIMSNEQALRIAYDFDTHLQNTIDALNARMRTLDEQMRVADAILAELGAPPSDMIIVRHDDDDDMSTVREEIDDSSDDGGSSGYESDESERTVSYYTRDENRYFSDEDEGYMSYDETIVGDWENPYLTPEKEYRLIYPDNLEEGLEHLG